MEILLPMTASHRGLAQLKGQRSWSLSKCSSWGTSLRCWLIF